MTREHHLLQTADGTPLQVTTYGEELPRSAPVLVFAHGFKGFKDWGFVPPLAGYFASRSFYVVTFNFSHNGIGNNPTVFDRLDLFEQNTFTREVAELTQVVQAVRSGQFGQARTAPLGVIGHSRGGAITLLTAAQLAEIKAVVTWSAVSHLYRYSEKQVELWRQQGFLEVMNQRTQQVMRLGLGLLEDIERHRDSSLSVENAVGHLDKPLLIIHGEQDEGVPVREAQELFAWSKQGMTDLFVVPNTGHTFGAAHPWNGSTLEFDQVLARTGDFFERTLA